MKPQIMAIGNVTPDSFYAKSRLSNKDEIIFWAKSSLEHGADILDIGGCSTRPGSVPADLETEWNRVEPTLDIIRENFPHASLSLDTFRPEIARRAIEKFGKMIVNDISGGDEQMYDLVRDLGVPYIWTLRGDLELPKKNPQLCDMDLILDPGLGFIGSVEGDYDCLKHLDVLREYGFPILVGLSRKSMIYKALGLTPDTCLTPTQALQLYALDHGATILRTHDVAATRDIVTLYELLNK